MATQSMKRRGVWIAAALALAAAVAVPATLAVAADSTDMVGPVVTVDATGGDVRAAGASVSVTGTAANVRAAGAQVDVSATAAGSVWAAGAKVTIGGSVGGDVKAAGAAVGLTARVTGDAQAAAAIVEINSTVGGNVRAGGATVTIGPAATIDGTLQAGGANVSMTGRVTGATKLAGASVNFDGQVDSTLEVAGDHVVIGPNARIGGDLTVYSRVEPSIADGAVITGTVHRVQPPDWFASLEPWMWAAGFAAFMVLGTIIAGIVLMLFGGRIFTTATDNARLRPVSSFLIGLIVAVLVPAIAIILMATVVGLSVGLALLFALPLLFVFGHAVAAAGIAGGVFVRSTLPIGIGRAILLLIVGAAIVALIGFIPWVGPLAVAVVILLGLGALVRTVGPRVRLGPPPPAPAAAPPPPAPPAEPA